MNKTNPRLIVTDNKVIALGQYHGRVVRATAKCAPNDTFDAQTGGALALARLDVKLTDKRIKYAQDRLTKLYDRKEALAAEIDKVAGMIERTEANLDCLADEAAEAENYLADMTASL